MSKLRGHQADAVRITTAPVSRSADIAHRQKRYVISMTIRTLCFIGGIAVGPGWLRWVLIGAAFVLPYIAVVMANSASPDLGGPDPEGPGNTQPELGGGQ